MRLPNFETASCREVGLELFFPESQAEEMRNKDHIRAICDSCPVFADCLNYSLTVMVEGIWAGNNKHERRIIRRARGIKATPLEMSIGNVLQSNSRTAIKQRKARANK